jgi:hypothetical protein
MTTQPTTDHLDAINERLAHAKARCARTNDPRAKAWFEHEVQMIERERNNELAFLAARGVVVIEPSIEELLAELDALEPQPTPRRRKVSGFSALRVDDVSRKD